jgi:hypothetical protein
LLGFLLGLISSGYGALAPVINGPRRQRGPGKQSPTGTQGSEQY